MTTEPETAARGVEEIRAELAQSESEALDLDAQIQAHERAAVNEKQGALSGDNAAIERGALAYGRIKMLESVRADVDAKTETLRDELATAEIAAAKFAAVGLCAADADEANAQHRIILEEIARLAGAISRAFSRITDATAVIENARESFAANFDVLVPRVASLSDKQSPDAETRDIVEKYLEDIKCQNGGVSLDVVLLSQHREKWIFDAFGDIGRVFPEQTQLEKDATAILNELQCRLDDVAESQRRRQSPIAFSKDDNGDVFRNYQTPKAVPRISVMPNSRTG